MNGKAIYLISRLIDFEVYEVLIDSQGLKWALNGSRRSNLRITSCCPDSKTLREQFQRIIRLSVSQNFSML